MTVRIKERVSIERIEEYLKKHGPRTTVQLRIIFGISSISGFPAKLHKSTNLKHSQEGKTIIWEHREII